MSSEKKDYRQKLQDAVKILNLDYDISIDMQYWEDSDGNMIHVSPSCERITGYNPKEFINNPKFIESIILKKDIEIWREHHKSAKRGDKVHEIQFRIKHKEDKIIWIEHVCQKLYDENEVFQGFRCSNRDITERKKTEEQIKRSLKEKEVLLKEVHHRVKNNMQIVMSLLNLQANAIEDKVIREAFAKSNSRINAMALIHETFYQTDDFSKINPEKYISKLIQSTASTLGSSDKQIEYKLEIEIIELSMDEAIPLALVINELLTNSYKHAFPNRSDGNITIVLKEIENNTILLEFFDNGVGMPSEIIPHELDSLGMQLIYDLVEGQLKGEVKLESTNGTRYRIVFNRIES